MPTKTTPLPQLGSPSQMWGAATQRHAPQLATPPSPPAAVAAAGVPGKPWPAPPGTLPCSHLPPAPRADRSSCLPVRVPSQRPPPLR